ncbi:MAG: hydrogenase maturation protease [Actinomycetia bacterium]|nr:hydrogenase maturation protease [Actinomycetes bacterium]
MPSGSAAEPAPHELLDDGFPPEPCDLLVIGCGNILRGDDAAGPLLIRELYGRARPERVRLVDGGTSGMDVGFAMRGAPKVVIVDASATGAAPGTVYQVPAAEVESAAPLAGLHSHNFRWDHALSLGRWLLGPLCPQDITVFLIEVDSCDPGAPLTPAVADAVQLVADRITADFYPAADADAAGVPVEISESGYLHLPAGVAAEHVPSDVVAIRRDGERLVLLPLASVANGGRVLKQRNVAGDRCVLVTDLVTSSEAGRFVATVDPALGTLVIDLTDGRGDAGV